MTRLGDYLQRAPLDRLDTDALAAHALGVARSYLYSHPERTLVPAECAQLAELIDARAAGVPLAYLTGRQEFWSLDLQVDRRVLVPRPETELLVELALERIAESAEVLDLGTGSGAIALALASERPAWTIAATDRDRDALDVTRDNAERLGLTIALREADWYAGVGGPYDAIVSNPPYVAAADPHLAALEHEPRAALVAGNDGLDALRTIVAGATAHLRPAAWLFVEHGWDQGEAVRGLFGDAGFEHVSSHRDLAGHDRVTLGQRGGRP